MFFHQKLAALSMFILGLALDCPQATCDQMWFCDVGALKGGRIVAIGNPHHSPSLIPSKKTIYFDDLCSGCSLKSKCTSRARSIYSEYF